jgi:hypothetical protein
MRLVLPGGARPHEVGHVGTVRTVAYRPLAGVEVSSRTVTEALRKRAVTWLAPRLPTIKVVLEVLVALVTLVGAVLGLIGLSR